VAKLAEFFQGSKYNFMNSILTILVVDKALCVVTIKNEISKTRKINLYVK